MLPYEHGGDVYGGEDIRLDFSVNTNPLGMPEAVERAIIERMPDYVRYPDPNCRALCRALAARHGLEPDHILCGNGASDLIFRICACEKPQSVLRLAPTFSEYARNAALFGGELSEYPLRESEGFVLDEGILSMLRPDIDILFLCNPNNPTGRLCPNGLLKRILARCGEQGTLVLLDECFLDFTAGGSLAPHLAEYPHLMILKAFTKLYAMAGLRLGYLLSANAALLRRIAEFGATWSVSAVAQEAGLAALSVPDWTERTRALVEEERGWLVGELRGLGLKVYESEANFLLGRSERPLIEPLRRRGILLRDCGNFSGLDGRYFRVGLKTRAENKVLVSAIRETLRG